MSVQFSITRSSSPRHSELSSAVLRMVAQAGIALPSAKGTSDFIPASMQTAIIHMAGMLAPNNYVKGMQAIEAGLAEMRAWAATRGAA